MVDTYWTLDEARRWIIWRTLKAVAANNLRRAQLDAAAEGAPDVVGPYLSLDQLWEALRAEALPWFSGGARQPGGIWNAYRFASTGHPDDAIRMNPDTSLSYREPEPVDPMVQVADVMRLWPVPVDGAAEVPDLNNSDLLWDVARDLAGVERDAKDDPVIERHWLRLMDALWRGDIPTAHVEHRYYVDKRGPVKVTRLDLDHMAEFVLIGEKGAGRASLVGRNLDFYRAMDPVYARWFEHDPHSRRGLAVPKAAIKEWQNKPTPKALADHTAHRTIAAQALAWHRESSDPLLSPVDLAKELIVKAKAGAFQQIFDSSTGYPLTERGERPSNFDVRGGRLVETFKRNGDLLPREDIGDHTDPAETRLSDSGFTRWRESNEGRELARRYQLSESRPAVNRMMVGENPSHHATDNDSMKKDTSAVSLPASIEKICRRLIEEKKACGAPRYPKTAFVKDVTREWGQPLGTRREAVRRFHDDSAEPLWKQSGNKPRVAETSS